MKKFTLILMLALIGFSSCGRRYTCPTYLKNEDAKKDVRAKNIEVKKINIDEKN